MAKVHIYRTYRFIDKDPVIDAIRTVVQKEHLKNSAVHSISGVATATLNNWFDGATRKPQNSTISAVTSALGYVRRDDIDERGNLVIGYRKARDLNYKDEIEKQADWLIKHAVKKPKKRKKQTNGH